MQTVLEYIKTTIEQHTALSFAEQMLSMAKMQFSTTESYYDYLYHLFSNDPSPTIEELEGQLIDTYAKLYVNYVKMLEGWKSHGSLFVLDKRNNLVMFIFNIDDVTHDAYVHYNPTKFDCIKWSMPNNTFFKGVEDDDFVLSKDETEMIRECDARIAAHVAHFLNLKTSRR